MPMPSDFEDAAIEDLCDALEDERGYALTDFERADFEAFVRETPAILGSICDAMDTISDLRYEIVSKYAEERAL